MKKTLKIILPLLVIVLIIGATTFAVLKKSSTKASTTQISLETANSSMFGQLVAKRRSIRSFSEQPVSLNDISAMLWASQGISAKDGDRTTPSAGGCHPLTLYLSAKNIGGLEAGLYRYIPDSNSLERINKDNLFPKIPEGAYNQTWVSSAAAIVIVSADFSITAKKYGKAAAEYVYMEAGAATENLLLQATELNLATTFVGGVEPDKMQTILKIPQKPLIIIPIGHKPLKK